MTLWNWPEGFYLTSEHLEHFWTSTRNLSFIKYILCISMYFMMYQYLLFWPIRLCLHTALVWGKWSYGSKIDCDNFFFLLALGKTNRISLLLLHEFHHQVISLFLLWCWMFINQIKKYSNKNICSGKEKLVKHNAIHILSKILENYVKLYNCHIIMQFT